jgi:hypothetical protein
MKITVLGAGGAFADMKRGNSAFLVMHEGHRILIDCGMTVPYVLRDEMGIPLESITDIILTHTHSDHTGGLEMLLHACRWIGNKPPRLWAHHTVRALVDAQMKHLVFEKDGSICTGWENLHLDNSVANTPLGGLSLDFYPVKHCGLLPAFAVKLGPLAVSGDTCAPVMSPGFWKNSSLIFHEAESGFQTFVHTPILDLVARCCEDDVRGKPVWVYHCPVDVEAPGPLAGVLQKGQVFEL